MDFATQQPVNPAGTVPPPSSQGAQGASYPAEDYYSADNIQQELDTMLATDGDFKRFADSLKDAPADIAGSAPAPTMPPESMATKLLRSVNRGAFKAFDAISNTVVGAGAGIAKKTGLYKAFNDEQGQKDFLQWWDGSTKDANPIQFGDEAIDRMLPKPKGLGYDVIEGVSQFATGMALLGVVGGVAEGGAVATSGLPYAARVAGGMLARGVPALSMMAKAAVVDMTVFDPHINRLSNLVESGPSWMSNVVSRYLQNKDTDTEFVGHIKNGFEGLLVGATIESFIAMAGATRARIWQKAGKISDAEALRDANAALNAPVTPTQDALVVAPTDRGTWTAATPEELSAARTRIAAISPPGDVPAVLPADFDILGSEARQLSLLPNKTPEQVARLEVVRAEISTKAQAAPLPEPHGGPRAVSPDGAVTMRSDAEQQALLDNVAAGEKRTADRRTASGQPPLGGLERRTGSRRQASAIPDVEFQTREEAEQAVAATNFFAKNEGTPTIWTPALAERWKAAVDRLVEGTNDPILHAEDVARMREGTDFNMNYIMQPEEVVAAVEGMAETLPADIRLQGKTIQTHAQTRALARELFPSLEIDPLQGAINLFESTKDLPQKLTALRGWMFAHSNVTRKLAQMAEAAPDNAAIHEQLFRALDTMGEMYGKVSGSASNVARGLNAMQVPVDSKLTNPIVKRITQALDDLRTTRTARENVVTTGDEGAIKTANTALNEAVLQIKKLMREQGNTDLVTPAPKQGADPAAALTEWIDKADAWLSKQLDAAKEVQAGGAPVETRNAKTAVSDLIKSNRAPKGMSVTQGRTRAELRALARQVFLSEGDPAEILDALTTPKVSPDAAAKAVNPMSAYKKFWQKVTSFRINAMLSAPHTHLANMVGNFIALVQRPVEYWYAGARFGSTELRDAGSDMLIGMHQAAGDAWKAARKSMASGTNVLDPGNTHTGQTVMPWGNASWLSKIFGAPSRMLMGEDEFFSQLNYRANARAQILQDARQSGVTDATELANRVSDGLRFSTNAETGAGVNPLALEYSRVGTFKNKLEEGTIGRWLQKGQNNPVIQFILPFVRTPTNLFRFAWERTPVLNRLMSTFREDLAAGGDRAALAKAKSELGGMVWMTSALLASQGVITGRGPSDPVLRKQWTDAGWQPYSIHIPGTNRYVSYRRADPLATTIGIMADLTTMMGEMPDNDREQAVYAVMASITASVSSKTYLQGLVTTMDALSSGDATTAEALVRGATTSFIPNILNQMNPDPVMRETRGMVDAWMARVPGLSNTLEPRRNMLGYKVMKPPMNFAQSINPFVVSNPVGIEDNILDELLKLGRAMPMPPTHIANGQIDLTDRNAFSVPGSGREKQSPYDRLMELIGTGLDGKMPTLQTALVKLINKSEYKDASDGGIIERGGLKYKMAAEIVMGYRQAAYGQMLAEYPAIAQKMGMVGTQRGDELSGPSTAPPGLFGAITGMK